ncbi:hypothetical protein DXG01_004699 [Tephrocybe rancida]|nr:hypothetical protein DXG01_004699 [Tephrocybe rancida]
MSLSLETHSHSTAQPQNVLTEEDIELDNMMRSRSSSPVNTGAGGETNDSNPILRTDTQSNSPSLSAGGQLGLSGNRNELAAARRHAARAKLNPYQCGAVEEFTKDSVVGQQTRMYIKQFQLENKFDSILSVTPPFIVTKPLMDNIRSFSMAVLLLPKLSAYKGYIPANHLITILLHNGLHLPENINKDPNALLTLRTTVNEVLTQLRSSIKKDRDHYIDGIDFWDKVDTRLTKIRERAAGDAHKMTNALTSYLTNDRKKYATGAGYTIPEECDAWQQDVDDSISRTTPKPPPPPSPPHAAHTPDA